MLALQSIAGRLLPDEVCGSRLLSERAALLGLSRRGQVSPNGSCRLLRAEDCWLALNLARDDDWAMLPALLEREGRYRRWADVAAAVRQWRGAELVARARLMGIPAALYIGELLGAVLMFIGFWRATTPMGIQQTENVPQPVAGD